MARVRRADTSKGEWQMGYFNNTQTNILGLTNLNTGNQLKAGDKTELRYRLTDSNNDVLNLQGQTADIFLKTSSVATLLTSTIVTDKLEVAFTIDTVLSPGPYELEVVINDSYIFPSDSRVTIVIYPSYLSVMQGAIEDIESADITQLKQYVKELVTNGLDAFVDKDTTYVAGENVKIDANNVITAIDTELREEVAKKQNQLTAGNNVTIEETGIISAVDTIYDDTRLQSDVAANALLLEGSVSRLKLLETDVNALKIKTTAISTNIVDLSDLVDTLDEADLSEVYALLDTITGEIAQLETDLGDTPLSSQVATAEATLNALVLTVNELIANGGTVADIDISLIAGLQAEVAAIEKSLDAIVYDDSGLRALIAEKQPTLTAGENVTIDASNIISSVDTIYNDANIQATLTAINTAIDNLITGAITSVEFIARLTVLETDMKALKSKTANLSDNMTDLATLVASIEDVDMADIYHVLATITEEIAQLKSDIADTALSSQVNSVEATLDALVITVNELVANGGTSAEIDPEVLTGLQTAIDTLTEQVGVLSTEYNIKSLIARVEDIENLAYHFKGMSSDVIQFIKDNSVRALRFKSEYNLLLNATRMYTSQLYPNRDGNWPNIVNMRLAGNMTGTADYITYNTGSSSNRGCSVQAIFNNTVSNMLLIKGETVAIRINPAYGLLNEDGSMKDPTMHFIIRIEGIERENGTTYTEQLNLSGDDIVDGQVNVALPITFQTLTVVFLPSHVSTNNDPNGSLLISSLLPVSKTLVDDQFMGMWIIEETVTADESIDAFTMFPTYVTNKTAVDEAVKSASRNIIYAGDRTIVSTVAEDTSSLTFNTAGVIEINFVITFSDGTSITVPAPIEIAKMNSVDDFTITSAFVPVGSTFDEAIALAKAAIVYTGSKTIDIMHEESLESNLWDTAGTFDLGMDVVFTDGSYIQISVSVTIVDDGTEPTDLAYSTEYPFISYHIEKTSDDTRTDNNLYLQVPTIADGEEVSVTFDDVNNLILAYGTEDERLYDFQVLADNMMQDGQVVSYSNTIETPKGMYYGGTDLNTGYTDNTGLHIYW